MDTQIGILSYLTPLSTPPSTFSPGALVTNFLHLGQGNEIAMPIPVAPAFFNAGPGMSFFPYLHPLLRRWELIT
jgi:hypothetical protein